MGSSKNSNVPTQVNQEATNLYNKSQQPSPYEQNFSNLNNQFAQNYLDSVGQQKGDYTDIMGQYKNLQGQISPTNFGFQNVTATRPGELNEAYGYLRQAAPGYQEFANTGGYSPTDIQDLRARGISPIRAAYGNTMMELDRARALGGDAGSPNYIAAVAQAERNLPQQMADAEENVNARLAEDVRSGRLAGLAGLSGIGGTMGGLSSEEAGRQLSASLANQRADLEAQNLSEQSRQNAFRNNLATITGQQGLYGTTPGMAATFGNQALNANSQLLGAEQARNRLGLDTLGEQIKAYSANKGQQGFNWGGLMGSMMPLIGKIPGLGGGQGNPQGNDQGQNNYNDGTSSLTGNGLDNWDNPYYNSGYQFGEWNGPGYTYGSTDPNEFGTTIPNPTLPGGDGSDGSYASEW